MTDDRPLARPPLVILVRHTESQHHVARLTGGWTDTPLTERGREQAARTGRRLRDELSGRRVRLYSSDLLRAAETASLIGEALGVAVEPEPLLREHNNGECAGLTHDEAAARYPDTWLMPVPLDRRPYPGAETPREFYARAGAFIDALQAGPDEIPVAVTHGGTLICLVARWLGLPAEVLNPFGFDFYTGSITVLRCDRFGPEIERMNDIAHLVGTPGWVPIVRSP
jgi:probable phosphoglycerate mutase